MAAGWQGGWIAAAGIPCLPADHWIRRCAKASGLYLHQFVALRNASFRVWRERVRKVNSFDVGKAGTFGHSGCEEFAIRGRRTSNHGRTDFKIVGPERLHAIQRAGTVAGIAMAAEPPAGVATRAA